MSKEVRHILLINGSPKPDKEKSTSEMLLQMQEDCMKSEDCDIHRINVHHSIVKDNTTDDFYAIRHADAVIFTFPLYIFCLPGILMQYLQDYYQYWSKQSIMMKDVKLYAVVNCGFSEYEINEEAVRVIQSFSRQVGADFRFGVLIGAGGMLLATINEAYMKKTKALLNDAFHMIMQDIRKDGPKSSENINIPLGIPRKLYYYYGDKGWIQSARKNGLKKKDLFKKPYNND